MKDYDYASAGAYFVTICTQERACLFGEIAGKKMLLNDAGWIVESVWEELPSYYKGVDIDAFVVMPNHIHGIIVLHTWAEAVANPTGGVVRTGQARGPAPTGTMSLGDTVQRFKSLTTAQYREGVAQNGWLPFRGKLWQRNYYERVIRNERELNAFREYIANNPMNWSKDEDNPSDENQP